jgi:hypothetical protein
VHGGDGRILDARNDVFSSGDGLDRALVRMPLLAEEARNVTLAAAQPRINRGMEV